MLSWKACFLLPPSPQLKAYQFLLVGVGRKLVAVWEPPAANMDKHYLGVGHPYVYRDHNRTLHHCLPIFCAHRALILSLTVSSTQVTSMSISALSEHPKVALSLQRQGPAGHFRKNGTLSESKFRNHLVKRKLGLFSLDNPLSLCN